MNKWLQHFKYHVSLGYWEFFYSILIVLAVAIVTVGYRTYRAALTNPADILKYE
jgi:putative ABC transport system permease protein